MVINKFGDRLYTGLQDTIRAHLQGISQRIDEAQGEGFLRELKLRWGNHNKSMQMIRDILMVCPCTARSCSAFVCIALASSTAILCASIPTVVMSVKSACAFISACRH